MSIFVGKRRATNPICLRERQCQPGEYTDDIPPEALTDARFAAMIAEAEKYLGYPTFRRQCSSTSFDCSGLRWVINQSGVGSVGRTTATGYLLLFQIPPSEAKPGDNLFHSTYDSAG